MNRDLALGGATLAIAAAYYAMASTIQRSLLSDQVGPDRLPKTYAVLLAALSVILIVRSLRQGETKPRSSWHASWRVAGMLLIGAIYIAILPWLGYLLALALLIAATAAYQRGAINLQITLVAIAGAVLLWLLFVWLLGVPQPSGFWPSLLEAAGWAP